MGANHDRLVRELVMVQADGSRHVGMLPDVHAEFTRVEKRWRKKLEQHFKHYGIPETDMLEEHFKSLGHFPAGNTRDQSVHLFEFKARRHRLYGTIINVASVQTFVGLKLVTDKKTNRADQDLLRRIAKNFAAYLD